MVRKMQRYINHKKGKPQKIKKVFKNFFKGELGSGLANFRNPTNPYEVTSI